MERPLERAELMVVPFAVADASRPNISTVGPDLQIEFLDWRASFVKVVFSNCIAMRWQSFIDTYPQSRDDETYEIFDSTWLSAHRAAGEISDSEEPHHYRLCFNACGQLDVISLGLVAVRGGGEESR